MRLTTLSVGAVLILASAPAYAQLANSGSLLTTGAQPTTGPAGSAAHQSATMAAVGGGTRGGIASVNGGDLAPGVNKGIVKGAPSQVGSNTPPRAAGAYVQAVGPNSNAGAAGVRVDVANGLGAGPGQTYRDVTINAPKP